MRNIGANEFMCGVADDSIIHLAVSSSRLVGKSLMGPKGLSRIRCAVIGRRRIGYELGRQTLREGHVRSWALARLEVLYACELAGGPPQRSCCCDNHFMAQGCEQGGGCETTADGSIHAPGCPPIPPGTSQSAGRRSPAAAEASGLPLTMAPTS
jgi:hypothetical protein